jgi:hypothetical protein
MPTKIYCQNQWNPFYDYSRKYHFGFSIGFNSGSFKYKYSDLWYNQDSIKKVENVKYPGVCLGFVADLHIKEYFNLRFLPSFLISQRDMVYYNNNNRKTVRELESAMIEFPILLKFKSSRHQNMRFYAIAGIKYSIDLASDKGATEDPTRPKLILEPHNYGVEAGTGLDLYFKYFKFSPEIKFSRGLNNVLIVDDRIYSKVFKSFHSNFTYFTLYFEG